MTTKLRRLKARVRAWENLPSHETKESAEAFLRILKFATDPPELPRAEMLRAIWGPLVS